MPGGGGGGPIPNKGGGGGGPIPGKGGGGGGPIPTIQALCSLSPSLKPADYSMWGYHAENSPVTFM